MSQQGSFLKVSFLFLSIFTSVLGYSQDVRIELGPDEIPVNTAFTIKLTVSNDRLKNYDKFPEIPGFTKIQQSSYSGATVNNGQISSTYSITQNYAPSKEGVFTVPNFTMRVNDEVIKVKGKKVKVVKARQQQQRQTRDPLQDIFDRFNGRSQRQQPQEFIEIEDDAFMAVSTDKNEVYLGEGFNVIFALYLPEDNHADYALHEVDKQLQDMVKKIKPASCWEESFEIREVTAENIQLNGKKYKRFKFFQAAYYPQSLNDIEFPAFDFKLVKYKLSKGTDVFGRRQRQTDYKTFKTKKKQVKVKDLPPHPLKDQVAVGNYRLDERINSKKLNTGQTFDYRFKIFGEGNITSIMAPELIDESEFDVYDPVINQRITREGNSVRGDKSFDYYLIPNEPGEFDLGEYFEWIFFNPQKEEYDTLKSKITVLVAGESKKNSSIESTDLGTFYDRIQAEDNRLIQSKDDAWKRLVVNIFILSVLLITAITIFKK